MIIQITNVSFTFNNSESLLKIYICYMYAIHFPRASRGVKASLYLVPTGRLWGWEGVRGVEPRTL